VYFIFSKVDLFYLKLIAYLVTEAMSNLLVRQKHATVPSSDSPPLPEWTAKYWYVIRAWALQAKESLDDDEAGLLVKSFEALSVTLPCQECRAHYKDDWAAEPYTVEHARDLVKSVKWVEDLRAKIDARRPAPPVSAAPVTAVPAPATRSTSVFGKPAPARSILGNNPRVTPVSKMPTLFRSGSVRDKSMMLRLNPSLIRNIEPAMSRNPAANAAQSAMAVSSAVVKTRSNRSGGGCGCRRG
jgi:hypothetical protein